MRTHSAVCGGRGLPAVRARSPQGRMVELPGRGSTYVTDTPGPAPESPTIVLLHALGCTGLLTWFPAIAPLSRSATGWSPSTSAGTGAGISSEEFSLYDCADDVARADRRARPRGRDRRRLLDGLDRRPAGLAPAPRQGRRPGALRDHRPVPDDAAASASFFTGMGSTHARAAHRRSVADGGARVARGRPGPGPRAPRHRGVGARASGAAPARGRSPRPSPRSAGTTRRPGCADRRAHRGRGHRQGPRHPARPPARRGPRIPGATIHDIDTGHAACVLESETFVPAFLEAVATVNARRPRLPAGARASATRPA